MSQLQKPLAVAVVGAGNGGLALGAYMALSHPEVRLYDKFPAIIEPIVTAKGVYLHSPDMNGFVPIQATTDLAAALQGANLIMVATPADAHRDVARSIAPCLEKGSVIVLNPGRTGGALEMQKVLSGSGAPQEIIVAEAQTMLFAARKLNSLTVKVSGIKNAVKVAALPGTATQQVVAMLNCFFPQFIPAANVLETSLSNIGAIFHPAPTILNAARIETTAGEFDYYHEGISSTVALILEKMDDERVAVARAMGISVDSAKDWLFSAYGVKADSLYEAIVKNTAYRGIRAPKSVNVRYLFEDVPTGLVPIASLGRAFGCPTPFIDCMINLASAILATDYWLTGRNLENLGLSGLSPADIIRKTSGYCLTTPALL